MVPLYKIEVFGASEQVQGITQIFYLLQYPNMFSVVYYFIFSFLY